MKLKEFYREPYEDIEAFLATVIADISDQFKEEAERLFSEENKKAEMMDDLQAASEAVERIKIGLQEDLRGNLISRLRYAMDLSDDCPVPAFVFETALAQLNDALE